MACDRKIGIYPCCSVVQGDCLELMKALPDGCVDAVITDPPYESEAHVAMRRTRSSIEGRSEGVGMAFPPITEETRSRFVYNSLRIATGWVLAFCQAEAVGKYRELFNESWRRPMVWVKPDAPPQFTGDRPAMGYESICAAWAGHGKSKWNGGGKRGVFEYNSTDYEHLHQTQKPEDLMVELCRLFTSDDVTILDPFIGSGTTLVAAKKLGRHFLGFEISEEYCVIARDRLARIDAQPNLFEPKPEQLSLGGGE